MGKTLVMTLIVCTISCAQPAVKMGPCLTGTIPPRAKIAFFTPPERVDITDSAGNVHNAYHLTVDPTSMIAFFGYVETLENLVTHAQQCIEVVKDAGVSP